MVMFVQELVCVDCGRDPADCVCGGCADLRTTVIQTWRETEDRRVASWETKDDD